MKTFYLSCHVDYACRNSGVCCSSGWNIPLEASRVEPIRTSVASGRIAPLLDPWLHRVAGAPVDFAGVLATTTTGLCVFHADSACAIQRVAGHDALPSACQHFPRICLIDPRGVFVTLSHYCPTAAAMLFDNLAGLKPRATHEGVVARGFSPAIDATRGFSPATIVEGPAALPTGEIPEGLDARDALPPLLTPRVLMDYDGYDAWEQHMIRTLTMASSPEHALAMLKVHARQLAAWRPGGVSLRQAVESLESHQPAMASSPEWPAPFAPVIGRYLAAHAFASWMAYQGDGIESIVRSLHVALATVRIETARACEQQNLPLTVDTLTAGIRNADLLLRHMADRQHSRGSCNYIANSTVTGP